MREHEVREGDIVRIEYDAKTKEHIDEGKALILWKGINRQPLVVKLDHLKNRKYNPVWTCYEYIAEVVGHMSIVDMLKSQCGLGTLDSPTTNGVAVDSISRQAVDELSKNLVHVTRDKADFLCNFWEGLQKLPPVTPQPCEDAVSRDCDKCAYYVDGANDEACDGCFADEYEHPNFKPKAQHCDDCISREEALMALTGDITDCTIEEFIARSRDKLNKLPSVTPKESEEI